jgi:pilus assembly protein Flp/PilA
MEMLRHARRFLHEEDGVTTVEYALVASLISLAAITAMGSLGNELDLMFKHIKNNLKVS